jgi:maltose/moltooligosaccharide transporter
MLFYQLGNKGNEFIFFYLREDLGMDLGETGWIQGIASGVVTVFGALLGYLSGSLIDRFKPIRVVPLMGFVSSALAVVSFFVITDKTSAVVMASLDGIKTFIIGVALGAVTVQLFPREKIGQFCSAQAFFYQTILMVLTPLAVAPFFDWLQFNRGAYLWAGLFDLLAAIIAVKVYFNWKKKHENDPPEAEGVSAS